MWPFNQNAEYERQLEESARQLAVMKAQQDDYDQYRLRREQQERETFEFWDSLKRRQEAAQSEQEQMQECARRYQERYGKLLDTWEEQSRRVEALLKKWEQKG